MYGKILIKFLLRIYDIVAYLTRYTRSRTTVIIDQLSKIIFLNFNAYYDTSYCKNSIGILFMRIFIIN